MARPGVPGGHRVAVIARRAGALAVVAAIAAVAPSGGAGFALSPTTDPAASACVDPNAALNNGVDGGATRFIPAPAFPTSGGLRGGGFSDSGIAAFAVDPLTPSTLLVSDGRTLLRSVDAGCTWAPAPLPKGLGVIDARIMTAALGAAGDKHRGYVLVHERREPLGLVVTPRLLHSEDGGRHWARAASDLPPVAGSPPQNRCTDLGPCALVVSPSKPDVVYVALTLPVPTPPELFASTDGGKTLRQRTLPSGTAVSPTALTSLVVDPLDAESLWVIAGGVHHSVDGGRSWKPVTLPGGAGAPVALDVSHLGGAPSRVTLLTRPPGASGLLYLVSEDSGHSFRSTAADGVVGAPSSIAQRRLQQDVVVTTSEGTFLAHDGPRFERLDLSGLVPDRVRSDRTADPAFYFAARTALIVYGSPVDPTSPLAAARAGPGLASDAAKPAARRATQGAAAGAAGARLDPATTTLALAAGASKTVTYRLALPPRPAAIDVFFLVDVGGSMLPAHAGLRRGLDEIIAQLRASAIDAWIGVGDFSEGQTGRYSRLRDLAPPDADLIGRVASIGASRRPRAPRGGRRGPGLALPLLPGGPSGSPAECAELEPNWTALDQMATGAGLPNPTCGDPVLAGQAASFRTGAVHVVVHLTDENIVQDPDGPTPAQTIADLDRAGVLHVGIEFRTVNNPVETVLAQQGRLHQQLVDLSVGTHSFAGAPIDCNGDGQADVPQGAPLVCTVTDAEGPKLNLAPPLLDLLHAVVDRSAVELAATSAGPVSAVVAGPPVVIDGRAGGLAEFPVTFSCRPTPRRATSVVRLTARAAGAQVASGLADVTCAGSAVRSVPPLAGGLAVALGPTPAIRAQVPLPPNPPPQATQLVQAAGLVPVPEHEVQLSSQRANDDDELLFGRRIPQGSRHLDALRLAGALALCLGAATVVRRQRAALRPSYQRSRRLHR